MDKWKIVKVEEGLAIYQKGNITIEITDAVCGGCYDLEKREDGKVIEDAFWHGKDMEIPKEINNIWFEYFGKQDFLTALDWVDWEEAEE